MRRLHLCASCFSCAPPCRKFCVTLARTDPLLLTLPAAEAAANWPRTGICELANRGASLQASTVTETILSRKRRRYDVFAPPPLSDPYERGLRETRPNDVHSQIHIAKWDGSSASRNSVAHLESSSRYRVTDDVTINGTLRIIGERCDIVGSCLISRVCGLFSLIVTNL